MTGGRAEVPGPGGPCAGRETGRGPSASGREGDRQAAACGPPGGGGPCPVSRPGARGTTGRDGERRCHVSLTVTVTRGTEDKVSTRRTLGSCQEKMGRGWGVGGGGVMHNNEGGRIA